MLTKVLSDSLDYKREYGDTPLDLLVRRIATVEKNSEYSNKYMTIFRHMWLPWTNLISAEMVSSTVIYVSFSLYPAWGNADL